MDIKEQSLKGGGNHNSSHNDHANQEACMLNSRNLNEVLLMVSEHDCSRCWKDDKGVAMGEEDYAGE